MAPCGAMRGENCAMRDNDPNRLCDNDQSSSERKNENEDENQNL